MRAEASVITICLTSHGLTSHGRQAFHIPIPLMMSASEKRRAIARSAPFRSSSTEMQRYCTAGSVVS